MIGENIEVKLVMLNDSQALIGIEAPRNVAIHRKEVYKKRLNMMNDVRKDVFFDYWKENGNAK